MVGNRLTNKVDPLDLPDFTLAKAKDNKLFSDKRFLVEGRELYAHKVKKNRVL